MMDPDVLMWTVRYDDHMYISVTVFGNESTCEVIDVWGRRDNPSCDPVYVYRPVY